MINIYCINASYNSLIIILIADFCVQLKFQDPNFEHTWFWNTFQEKTPAGHSSRSSLVSLMSVQAASLHRVDYSNDTAVQNWL